MTRLRPCPCRGEGRGCPHFPAPLAGEHPQGGGGRGPWPPRLQHLDSYGLSRVAGVSAQTPLSEAEASNTRRFSAFLPDPYLGVEPHVESGSWQCANYPRCPRASSPKHNGGLFGGKAVPTPPSLKSSGTRHAPILPPPYRAERTPYPDRPQDLPRATPLGMNPTSRH